MSSAGILDRINPEDLPPAERWSCRECGRNGFSLNRPNAKRRTEPCPDCEGVMDVWPTDEPVALRILHERNTARDSDNDSTISRQR